MNMIKCLKKLLIRLHEWVQKKWLIVSVLMSTSSIWFSLILSFWGEKLHFIVTDASGKRQFTFLGAILTILVVGFSCLLAMAQRYYEYSSLGVNSRGGVLGGIIEIKGYLLIIIIMCISKILSFKGSKNYGKDN